MKTKAKKKMTLGVISTQRHYCRNCGRKRNEEHMVPRGKAYWGKQQWQCIENCHQLRITTAYNRNNK